MGKVLVITLRGLHLGLLGCYGNDWIDTSTLDRLADLGWRAVVGDRPPRGERPRALGGDAVTERTESFDPLRSLG